MKPFTVIKTDLFADTHQRMKIDWLGNPLFEIKPHINFAALTAKTMVRVLLLKHPYNLYPEQIEHQLFDCTNCKRFCRPSNAANTVDRTTVRIFGNRIDEARARVLFDSVLAQLLNKDFIARSSQIIDKTSAPTPKQLNIRGEKAMIDQGTMLVGWKPAKRRQRSIDATWAKERGKNHFAYQRSINLDKYSKVIPRTKIDTTSTHASQYLDHVFAPSNTSRGVYVDRSSPPEVCEVWLKNNGFRYQIPHKGKRYEPLSDWQQRRNPLTAKTRTRIAQVCGAIEQMSGKLLRTIGQARPNFAISTTAAGYNLKWLDYSRKAGIEAF